jgi:predicted phage terminase large subunit-like protein
MIQVTTPLPAQTAFWNSRARHRLFVGGIGSGKTLAGCLEILRQPSGTFGTVIAPTYPMLRDATLLTFFEKFGQAVESHNKSEGVTVLRNGTTVFWRSADKPDSLRGPNLNWFYLDEADYMDGATWDVMLGRIRRDPTACWLTTSPNGDTNWVYERFYRKWTEGNPEYFVAQAKTRDNVHLPPEYVRTLEETYTSEFARQELEGEFIGPMGRIMRKEWLQYALLPEDDITYVIGVDLAVGMKSNADDRAIVVVGKRGTTYYVADVVYGKWSFNETKDKIKQTAYNWNAVRVCVENVAYQEVMVQQLRAETMLNIQGVNPRGRNKLTRFLPIAGKYEHGYIKHVNSVPLEFTEQLLMFDGKDGKPDDMVDALIYAVNGHESNTYVYEI